MRAFETSLICVCYQPLYGFAKEKKPVWTTVYRQFIFGFVKLKGKQMHIIDLQAPSLYWMAFPREGYLFFILYHSIK